MVHIPKQIRLKSLVLLIAEISFAAKQAEHIGTHSSYISQMHAKKGTPRNICDDLVEKLERRMNKHEGWMDEPHIAGIGVNAHLGLDIGILYPGLWCLRG